MTVIDWGDAPTWLAMGAAGVAGVMAAFVYKIEKDRDRAADQQRRRDQAVLVSAWAAPDTPEISGIRVFTNVLVVLANHSTQPIYDVMVRVEAPESNRCVIARHVLPPLELEPVSLPKAMLAAALGDHFGVAHARPEDAANAAHQGARKIQVELSFTDVEGRRYSRSAKGVLNEITR